MHRDISSSSSSDGEDYSPVTPTHQEHTEKTSTRYQCPADFVSFCHEPCSSTLKDSLKNSSNELWLIKAPASFNPQCGIQLPLSGLQTVRVPAGEEDAGHHIYNILASSCCSTEFRLLTANKRSPHTMVLAPPFSGLLNICESYSDSSANQAPQVITAAPAPTVPQSLKQRFQFCSSKTPTLTKRAGQEVDGEERRKKRKKDKQIKAEPQEVSVKAEPTFKLQELLSMDSEASGERRKKKKKDRERPEVDNELQPWLESGVIVKREVVTVKSEPIDILYGDEVEGKKKKKKKRSKSDD